MNGASGPQRHDGRSRIAVVIATRGRQAILIPVVESLKKQIRQADVVLISCTTLDDIGPLAVSPHVRYCLSEPGLTRQRNTALRELNDSVDVVIFFDDDFVAHPRWIEEAAAAFSAEPNIVAITGTVIADDVKGPGLSFEKAETMLDGSIIDHPRFVRERFSPYGCNMAFRVAAIRGLEFDERLPLYGWLEDRDFGGALAKRGGRLIKIGAARGVHLGVKGGRMPGRKLGYSQIANPLYLHRKGTMTTSIAAGQMFRNFTSNLVFALRPEPFVDRRGRLVGNLLALKDLVLRRLSPERATLL